MKKTLITLIAVLLISTACTKVELDTLVGSIWTDTTKLSDIYKGDTILAMRVVELKFKADNKGTISIQQTTVGENITLGGYGHVFTYTYSGSAGELTFPGIKDKGSFETIQTKTGETLFLNLWIDPNPLPLSQPALLSFKRRK